MERPLKIPPSVLLYVEYLENEIQNYKTDTKKKFYRGIQRQLGLLGDEMLREDFKVSMIKGEEDNGFDGFFDMMTKGDAIVKAMEKFEQQANPTIKDDSKKIVKEDGVEQFIKTTTNATPT